MRYIQLFLFFCLLGCKSEKKSDLKSIELANNEIKIQSEELKEIVTYLASDELKGRDTNTEGIDKAAIFIEQKFKDFGVSPYFDSYRDHFEFEITSRDSTSPQASITKKGYNLIGYIEGNDEVLKNEFIIIGAHYDHIGFIDAVENDSIANGANDNAAGSSAVISLARYYSKRKTNKRSILFCLFSAEELGLKGSQHLAKKLKSMDLNLYVMLNFEMIGVPMKGDTYKAYVTGYERSNMAEEINQYLGSDLIGFFPLAKKYRLFRRSDNHPFFEEFGVPAQTICTFDFTNFDYYHKVGDEADLMDYDFMADLINKLAPAIDTMATTTTKEIKLNDG
ncbi:MAG: M28 family peptidase [Bacteroidota bacterium]